MLVNMRWRFSVQWHSEVRVWRVLVQQSATHSRINRCAQATDGLSSMNSWLNPMFALLAEQSHLLLHTMASTMLSFEKLFTAHLRSWHDASRSLEWHRDRSCATAVRVCLR